ncbi:MAG: YceI family protein [Chitinophagaceae bacterium]
MKKLIVSLSVVIASTTLLSFIPANKIAADAYTVDTKNSKVEFVGSKTDGYHPGFFSIKSGSVTLDNGKLTGGSFVIDLANLKVTDDAGERLEGHLKAKDFFDVANFSDAKYEITSVKYTSEKNAEIDGKLTLKGITAPVKFNTVIRNADDKKFFGQASFNLDRTVFGINYGVGKISSDVQINVFLFATK